MVNGPVRHALPLRDEPGGRGTGYSAPPTTTTRRLRVPDAGDVAFNQQVAPEVVGWFDECPGTVTTR
jgi:hypothetical protein